MPDEHVDVLIIGAGLSGIEGFSSGYVLRAIEQWPRQGSVAPWRLKMSYASDLVSIRHGAIDDGTMAFSSPAAVVPEGYQPAPVGA